MRQRLRASILVVIGILTLMASISQAGCGSSAQGTVRKLGNTTTKNDVVGALESTGYDFRYRKVPRLEGYEVVSGEASQGSDRIEFTVEIRLAGPYEDKKNSSDSNPQPPILRYGGMVERQTVGNIIYGTMPDGPKHPGKEFELETDSKLVDMDSKVEIALRKLFARRFIPGP